MQHVMRTHACCSAHKKPGLGACCLLPGGRGMAGAAAAARLPPPMLFLVPDVQPRFNCQTPSDTAAAWALAVADGVPPPPSLDLLEVPLFWRMQDLPPCCCSCCSAMYWHTVIHTKQQQEAAADGGQQEGRRQPPAAN